MKAVSDLVEIVPESATQSLQLENLGSNASETLEKPTSPAPLSTNNTKGYLDVPPYVPSRTPSPGILSHLSADEWHTLNESAKYGSLQDPATWKHRCHAFYIRNLGLFYMLIAQLFGTAMNVMVRYLQVEGNKGKGMHPFQVLFVRMGITALLSTAYMAWNKTPYFPFGMPEVRWLLILRGIGGFFGVFGMYYSLLYLQISDAIVLTYIAPGLSCWACSILIKEAFTRVEKIGTFVSLAGVIFIARPTSFFPSASGSVHNTHSGVSDAGVANNGTTHMGNASDFDHVTPSERIGAVGFAMIGVCGTVAAFTTIRWIGQRAHPLISVNYFAVWCTLVSFVMQLAIPSIGFVFPADLKDWGLLIFLGTCGFIMQFLLAAGLSYEKSSRATNMTYTGMLFSLAGDKIFFGASPGISSIMGSTLILGAAIVMALQKAKPALENPDQVAAPPTDEERGLMQNIDGDGPGPGEERMPIQEVQLRTLR
ncbi:hypothetical protein K461DRAFT_221085 [Myriangium duriaei CBS 260.36]|uniref:EamA domain-containing protein n=1 Tax=Myriangium duriaei CBS 260.36 TaxID=1168546 RepID=A0A9P4J653_9PEZI|nr:hypothetical protein K461DRAFT_221085 [Myriangium duriaei CBS 260.36]